MKTRRLRYFVLAVLILILFIISILIRQSYDPNVRFRRLQKSFNSAYQTTYSPLFDSLQLGIIESKNLQARYQIFTYYDPQFASFNNRELSPIHYKEWQLTQDLIKNQMIYLSNLKKDPTLYNFEMPLKKILQQKDTPLQSRLQQLENKLHYASHYYTAAKDNLITPDSIKLKSAIHQQLQTLQFLRSDLPNLLARSSLSPSKKQKILQRSLQAQLAVKDYIAFCRSRLFEYQDAKK